MEYKFTNKGLSKWKNAYCFLTENLSAVKQHLFPKIYKCNAIPNNISTGFYMELGKLIQIHLKEKNSWNNFFLADIKTYHQALVIDSV